MFDRRSAWYNGWKIVGFFLLFGWQSVYADIYRVVLHYQNAESIIPIVQPLLKSGETLTGRQDLLILSANPGRAKALLPIVSELDTAPVSFTVEIYQGSPDWLQANNPSNVIVRTPTRNQQQQTQAVSVSNGESAYVSTGQTVPVVQSVGIGWWNGVSYEYKNLRQGLLIKPTLQGQQVRLQIKRVRDAQSDVEQDTFENQSAATTMMVPLNQWVSLASTEGFLPADNNTQVIRAGNNMAQSGVLFVRVRLAN